ncbi:MAG: nucleotidyl transferase AbiEii/AbiGii toxin family protein [Granulosicoccus sp.]
MDTVHLYDDFNGIKEALVRKGFTPTRTQRRLISENPEVTCPVVTPEGLMILKLICWADRARELRSKDAGDIRNLLKTYIDTKNINQDIYDDENIRDLENYGWDLELVACHLLGRHCRDIASTATHSEILKLNNSATSKNIERIAEEMTEGTAEENLNMLDAFMNGFT